jgi:hypothetical protein
MMPKNDFQFTLSLLRQSLRGSNLSRSDLVCAIGNFFLGAPYIPATLEADGKEKLIVNCAQFDCFTFVETVLALTACVANGRITSSEFRRALQLIRYRQGIIDGYSSRLHYFTDWLRDNEQKIIIRDISRKFGAVNQRKKINYMTTHREEYSALQNENEFKKMQLAEKKISRRIMRVIPRDKINRHQGKIKNGDILAFPAGKEGLDVAHVGFALWQGKKLHLLHAASLEGAVVVSKETLVAYLQSNKKFTGIIIARLS